MKKSLFIFLFFWGVVICSVKADPPANKGYVLVFDESFRGDSLNTGNWIYRTGRRTGASINGLNFQANVYVKDSTLHIVAKHEKINGVYENTGGGIISKKDFGYGYYESMSKPFMAGRGVHSAFWQRGSLVTGNTIFEIDSYEIDSKSWMATNNLYYTICPAAYTEVPWPHRAQIIFKSNNNGWIVDAYERTPEGVNFYDNGEVVARAEWNELNDPQSVWITALNGVGTVDSAYLPGETLFKYFRFYSKDYPGYNLLSNGSFEYNMDKIAASKPVSWMVSGTTDAVSVVSGNASRDKYKMRLSKSTASFSTTLTQKLTYILNGDYTLTAMVRSSGGLTQAAIKAGSVGGVQSYVDIPATDAWTKITIPVVSVINNQVDVNLIASGAAGKWIEIDDINLMKPLAEGQTGPTPVPFTTVSDPVWKLAEKEPIKFTGDSKFYFFDRNVGYGDSITVAFTVSAAIMANMTPIARIPSSGSSGWAVQLNENGSLTFRIGSVANHTDVTTDNVYSVGQSSNIACMFNKGTASVYVNGNLLKTVRGITQLTKDNATAGRLGTVGAAFQAVGDVVLPDSTIINTNTSMKNFNGTLQHIRIYNRSVQPSELLTETTTVTPELPGGNDKWQMKWHDEFDYQNTGLEDNWNSENGPEPSLLSSRWRENAVVSSGTLKLLNVKENRGGQSWTSGSIRTKQSFKYGYYECRYKYASAPGVNNSFGILSESSAPSSGKLFEIDVNTGHFPSEMNTSLQNRSDVSINSGTGEQFYPSFPKSINFSPAPDVKILFETPVKTRKIRLVSNYPVHFHIQEFRIYNVNPAGYPNVLSATADNDVPGLVNYARNPSTIITSSGIYGTGYEAALAADGGLVKHWVSQDEGTKWIQFEFSTDITIGCIQFISGWLSAGVYNVVIDDYTVQYFDGTEWVDIQSFNNTNASGDFAKSYHTYGVNWTTDSLTFYHDGNLVRSMRNEYASTAAPVFLSTGVTPWAGTISDAINGTQMEVDYVRIYEPVIAGLGSYNSNDQPVIRTMNSKLSVTVPNSQLLSVYDVKGMMVLSRKLGAGSNTIQFNAKGLYIVYLKSNKGVSVSKIIMI